MKTLANLKATVSDGKVTITADIVEKDFSQFPVQQQTILHASGHGLSHHRHLQIGQHGAVVKTPGKNVGFVLERQSMVDLATEIEPRLAESPRLSKLTSTLTVEINSELTPNLQWQSSADQQTWDDVAGQTTNTLDKTKVEKGRHVRLKASSDAGEMFSNSVRI